MVHKIHAEYAVSLSDFKKNPLKSLQDSDGEIVAVLDKNEPVFYCFPLDMMDIFVELMNYRDYECRFFEDPRKDI